ncbi:MAG: polysaccharide pyruvyl transferase family protein [Colwellia sp.]|jgi:Polysaccharide pyruvyl transferase.
MIKNKVNTLTFHGVLNHGAIMQAYALQHFLKLNGFDSELIDYKPMYFMRQVYRPAKGIKKTILKYSRIRKFKKFTDRHLSLTKEKYYKLSDFEKKLKDCYAVVCGSDQIWNKGITNGVLDPVFLQRYSSDVKKIAYAASAGANNLRSDPGVAECLSQFSAIGIREKHLVDDLAGLPTITTPKLVLDPTLLLDADEYAAICYSSMVPTGNFIVSYEVSTNETRLKYESFVAHVKSLTGLPVYHIGDKPISSADKVFLNIAPSDWVSFMHKAMAIVTNSFHGTAFAVNFNKPLFMLSHVDQARNVRPKNFLKNISMSKCFIESEDHLTSELLDELFLERPRKELERHVTESRQFLLNSLKEGEGI